MDVSALLLELYGRIPPLDAYAITGLDVDQLVKQPSPGANTIAWLVWHLARVQDSHVAEFLETSQVWVEGDWAQHFGLEPDPANTGYGHSESDMLAVRPESPEVPTTYLATVDQRTRSTLGSLVPADLDRVIDRRWDPSVTLGVRLVSIAGDCLQHAGQAAYARGLIENAAAPR